MDDSSVNIVNTSKILGDITPTYSFLALNRETNSNQNSAKRVLSRNVEFLQKSQTHSKANLKDKSYMMAQTIEEEDDGSPGRKLMQTQNSLEQEILD